MSAEGIGLLMIYPDTAWDAWVILGDDVRWFGDNYEDLDGPIYCRPARLFDDKVIEALRARRLGHVESGWHEDDYHRGRSGTRAGLPGKDVRDQPEQRKGTKTLV